jgi:hypothetical protein
MTDQPSPRRRFQFRLRTLMIGVTLLAVPMAFVAHEEQIVRERKLLLNRAPVFEPCDNWRGISWVRRMLGDEAVGIIQLVVASSDEEVERYQTAFPEASIHRSIVPLPPLKLHPSAPLVPFNAPSAPLVTAPPQS